MWQDQISEGKDQPAELGEKEFTSLGATLVLLLSMYKPIFGDVKAVMLDSGFFC